MGRTALIGDNSVEFIEKLLDIWNSGDCAVLIDWRIPTQRALEMMIDANVSLCYMDKNLVVDETLLICDKIKFVFFEGSRLITEVPDMIKQRFCANYSMDDALVLFSSGTTGVSKGVILSFFAINTNADAIIEYMITKKGECIYLIKSLAHASTIVGELLVALKSGARLIVGPTVVLPRVIFSNIKKYSVTILCTNPALLLLLADGYHDNEHDINSLDSIYVSGDILCQKHLEKARNSLRNINIFNVYGLTEAGPRVSAQRIGCNTNTSVGKPLSNVEVSIRNNEGDILGEDEYGSVYVKSPSLYKGYVVGNTKFSDFNDNGLNTGDIGYISNGELFIVGRADDVINVSAHKVYPRDVEKVVLDNMLVEDCAIVSECYRESVIIVCYYVADCDLSPTQINVLRQFLAPYEMPRRFYKVNDISKTLMGKKDYKKLQTHKVHQ